MPGLSLLNGGYWESHPAARGRKQPSQATHILLYSTLRAGFDWRLNHLQTSGGALEYCMSVPARKIVLLPDPLPGLLSIRGARNPRGLATLRQVRREQARVYLAVKRGA